MKCPKCKKTLDIIECKNESIGVRIAKGVA